jgi:hypothetical protein
MKRLALLGVLGTLAISTSTVAATAATTASPALAPAAVTAPVNGAVAGGGALTGTLTVTGFQVVDGVVNAVGTLSYQLTDVAGNVIGGATQALSIPLAQATGSCTILHLELGPLDLNLLGLMVHLDRVVLDITAQSGPGNLLGNLLCAVAHLLDGNAAPNALANLLNSLLRG